MRYLTLSAALFAAYAASQTVSGSAEGFAAGVTGGGNATPVYPTTLDELVSYLGDDEPRVVVLRQTFDFIGSQGTTTATGCAPWGTGAGCQLAINANGWCGSYPAVTVTYDTAGYAGIPVASDKTIIGEGTSGVILGRGLRINGATNVIVQNIAITDINPKYVWGGDAIWIDDTDLIWIDHVTTARIGRQHIVLGTSSSGRVTLSNNYVDGVTDYSPYCDGYHYWGILLDGSGDLVTLKGNYIYHTGGRSPSVDGVTLAHAVNNYWYDNNGHAIEIDASEGTLLIEGNVFQAVDTVVLTPIDGQLFTSPSTATNTACSTYLGRACQVNYYPSSGGVSTEADEAFLVNYEGKNIASASAYTGVAASVLANAGQGKI